MRPTENVSTTQSSTISAIARNSRVRRLVTR
jgi:hypothetical protein